MKTLPGKEISCIYDRFGPVRVFDDGNKRYLTFGAEDEQSCIVKASPTVLQHDYNRAMLLVLLFNQPQNATFLGLGGGTLPSCFSHHLPDIQLTVVELRQVVIDTAYKYFALPETDNLNLIAGDALTYIDDPAHSADGQCDLLFSDLFLAEGLEVKQFTRQFIKNALRVLSDEGWLVMNCLDEYRTEQVLSGLLGEHFTSVWECVTDDGNWVIIAGKSAEKTDSKTRFRVAKQWSERLGFSLIPHLKRLVKYC